MPFKATFDEFVNGLYFYSEMLFTYENVSYEVFLKGSETVVFCSEDMQQEYGSREEFEAKANIDGVLLKDFWADVIRGIYVLRITSACRGQYPYPDKKQCLTLKKRPIKSRSFVFLVLRNVINFRR